MSALDALILILAAATAGLINAVAGGGTLITFPVLLLLGTSSVRANATSTLALVIGTAGSVFGFRHHIVRVKPWLRRFIPVSLAGGLAGGILLTHTKDETFSKMVPFLLLFATVIFLAQGFFRSLAGFGQEAEPRPPQRQALWAAVFFQLLVSIYGGYFGAGIGILMLASLGFLGLKDIHEMNALKNVLGSLINCVAAAYFIYAGLIEWPKAMVMTCGALAGYFLGAHFSQQISQKRVRQIITAIGFIISAVLFYKQFWKSL